MKLNNSLFVLQETSQISVSCTQLIPKAELLALYLKPSTGYKLPISVGKKGDIQLILEGDNNENYILEVGEGLIAIKSGSLKGIIRGIMTLRQLLPKQIFSDKVVTGMTWEITGCLIKDEPKFKWRGMHLDVGRHFMDKEDVCKFIDTIALYKFNRFHFHLTEDQGWRIEIKKYPKLTEIGSTRSSSLIGSLEDKPKRYDDTPHFGYYTHEDIKEIVSYALLREIEIVPEIDMPGHMQAAIAAYPELGCTDMTLEPLCHWGISQHILNVEESTINFMKDVLDEVIELFPGDYIHIGGDEAPKYEWQEQRRIQDRMIELGLKSEDELQSWFISQVSKHIQSRGKKVIGWDEILEGGLAEGVAVMSWRGETGGIEAANLGHEVVMTPGSHVYFDHYQDDPKTEPLAMGGFTDLEKVYNYNPIPKELSKDKHHLVLGSQGQLWTEYMKDYKQVEYMAFPRACVLAEVLWSDSNKDYLAFKEVLTAHQDILNNLNVGYCKLK